jgi:hypothetical protein
VGDRYGSGVVSAPKELGLDAATGTENARMSLRLFLQKGANALYIAAWVPVSKYHRHHLNQRYHQQ